MGTIATGFVALVLVLGALLTSELDRYAGEDSSPPLNSQETGSPQLQGPAPVVPAPSPSEPEPSDTSASAAPGGTPRPAASPGPSESPDADGTNRAVLSTVNRSLASMGCDPVTLAPSLVTAARSHLRTMVTTGYLTLEAPDGTDPKTRARAAGYSGAVTEVIVLGAESPTEAATIGMPKPGAGDDALPVTVQVVARKTLSCGYTSVGADFRRDSRNVPIGVIILGRA